MRKLWIIEGIHVVEDLYTVEGGHEVEEKAWAEVGLQHRLQ